MTDQNVREFLERMAHEEPVPFLDAKPLTRRALRRAARTVVVGAVGVAAAVAVLFAGASQLRQPSPRVPANPSVDLGIFEPVAGRIVSGVWAVDPIAVDPSAPTGSTTLHLGPAEVLLLGWSSDGTKLLFMREDPTDETFPYAAQLYILHADGTETQLNTTGMLMSGATIAPDGSQVIFAAADDTDSGRPDLPGLFVVDAAGGQPVQIADEGASPTFSPDGTQIAYLGQSGPDEFHVWIADADGTHRHEILADEPTVTPGGPSGLVWSPAGDRIAMDTGGGAIYTFAPDGSDFTKVITGGINPFWSPDGSQIAYMVPFDAPLEGDSPGLAIADRDGSNVRTFGFAASGPWHPGAPAVDEPTSMPDPTTSTAPSPGSSRFASTIHGLSIDVPSGWQTRPATEPWTGGELDFDSPAADVIFHPTLGDRLYFVLASQPFESPTEAADWDGTAPGDWDGLNDVRLCLPGEGGHGLGGPFPVDGGSAFELQACGSYAVAVNWADTRGYVIALVVRDEPGLRETYDQGYFDAALETVDLRPEEAVEAPGSSP